MVEERPPEGPDISPEDRRCGDLLVQMGFCTRAQVEDGIRELRRRLAQGASQGPSLEAVLIERGDLSEIQAQSTLRLPEQVISRPSSPSREPIEASEAAKVPENRTGKYVKVAALGRGGMGEVWKAWDRELCRWVALKFLHHEDPEQLARFRREAQMAARLSHPNIAAVYDVGQAGGKHYIAMQYVPGRTLGSMERLPDRQLVELIRDAALAIHAAHEQGTIHRDLKPNNLMVVEEASRPRVFVLDFGLARPATGDSSVSGTGIVLGTPAYMSPEQARAESHRLGPASDVYGLGATLYEGLTGRPPFIAGDTYALLKKVVDDDPPPPRSVVPALDRDLETVVMRCLEKDPERRYASARAFADDLTRWLHGEAILARRPSVAYRARKFISRKQGVVIASAVGAAAVAATLAILVPAWSGSRERERIEAAARAKDREAAARRESFLNVLGASWSEVVRAREWIRQPFRKPGDIRRELVRTLGSVDALVKAHPEFAQGYYVRARVRLGLFDLEGAEADLREALRRQPDLAPAWSLLARVRMEEEWALRYQSRYSQTDAEARRARELLREREEALRRGASLRSDSQAWLPRLSEDEINDTVSRAMNAAFLEENVAAARRIVQRAFDQSPSEEYARFLAMWSGEAEERRRWLEEAIRIAPHFAAGRFDRAAFRMLENDADGAIEDYTRAIELRPEFAPAFHNRGNARARRGDYDGALKDYDEAIRLSPGLASAYYNRGRTLERKGDATGAMEAYSKALTLHPRYLDALHARGLLELARGDERSARADLDLAVQVAPDDPSVRFDRARARRRLDARGAAEDYTKCLELRPDHAETLVNRGNIWMELGESGRALEDFTKAVQVQPKMAAAWRMRANYWFLKGDDARAEEDLTRSLDLDPTSPLAFGNRGAARLKRGDARGAVADLEQALKIAPPGWTSADHFRSLLREARGKAKE